MTRTVDPDCRCRFDTVAANVKRIRGDKMMDQSALASAARVSRSTVSSIETRKNFSVQSLIKIAMALGVEPGGLFLSEEDRAEISYKQKKLWEKLSI